MSDGAEVICTFGYLTTARWARHKNNMKRYVTEHPTPEMEAKPTHGACNSMPILRGETKNKDKKGVATGDAVLCCAFDVEHLTSAWIGLGLPSAPSAP